MSKSISQNDLKGVAEALAIHAPHLLQNLFNIVDIASKNDSLESLLWTHGTRVFTNITSTVSWKDGEPILKALENLSRKVGDETVVFNDLTVEWLINSWRQFVAEPPQFSQQ